MKTTPPPTPIDDDFSYYYTFFQDQEPAMPQSKKRRLSGAPTTSKSRSIARLLSSLAALDSESDSDRRAADDASLHDLSLLRLNHSHKTRSMLFHRSNLLHHFDSLPLPPLPSTAAVAAVAAAGGDGGGAAASTTQSPHHQRRLWVKDRSRAWWDRCCSAEFPESEFRAAFRMSKATFDLICDELGSAVAKEDTTLRAAIPVRQRVAVCIWRLATGEPLRLVSKRFGLGISTCHKLVLEVCSAIKSRLMPRFLSWPESPNSTQIQSQFESLSGIPGIVGALYTTHIPIIAPKISVAAYFNRRHTERNQKTSYSITVQGVVDPNGVFTDVCIGWPGSMPDDEVLSKSALHHRAASGLLANTYLVGGPSFPLLDWVMVPYTHQNLTWTQHAFNEKIGEVHRVAKGAFARLKGRWSCLQKRTEVKLQDLPVVLGACCVLHNVCEMRNEEMDPKLMFELVDDEVVPENSLRSVSSMQARDTIAHNLLHRGLAGTTFF